MITLSGVAKAHGVVPLFRDVSLQLVPGRRIALVGGNGVGKTTLLEIAIGLQQPDAGEVGRAKGVRVGHLPQDLAETPPGTILEETLGGAEEVVAIERRLHTLQDRLDDRDALHEYGHLQERFRQLGGFQLEADAHRVLAGLGFAPDDGDRPVRELSGGWRVRVALARLLLSRPDVLVLDEPTNHLDVDSIRWLEATLATYEGAILFVSHDRDFIDAVADRVVELAAGTATEYVGGFDDFVVQREERVEQLRRARAQQDRWLAQQERFVERFRYKASKARAVQSRLKRLDRVERVDVPDLDPDTVRFGFPEPPRAGRVVVELAGVTAGYDGRPVLRDVDLAVERGRCVGVIGPNGGGKSTLLRVLTGELPPMAGEVSWGHNVQIATFAQHQAEVLHLDRTVIEEFSGALGEQHRGRNARTMLGAFGFSGDAADRRVGALSGGERTRLALARVMANPVNLLVLDEPTNHLDIPSRDVLEDAVAAYPGTVLLVTHDRHVIRNTADMIVEVRAGGVTVHDGGYDDFRDRHDRVTAAPAASAARSEPDPAVRTRDDRAERKRREAELRNRLHRETRHLRDAVERLEAQVGRVESEVAELTRRLADPAVYDDGAGARELVARHATAKDRAAELMARWEEASLELDQAEARVHEDTA